MNAAGLSGTYCSIISRFSRTVEARSSILDSSLGYDALLGEEADTQVKEAQEEEDKEEQLAVEIGTETVAGICEIST